MIDRLKTDRKHYRLIENLEVASKSISDNIAEGKGRNSDKEFRQYLYISRGFLYEVISKLNFFHRLTWINDEELKDYESDGTELCKMLNSLLIN